MALDEFGYRARHRDVGVLLTAEGLAAFKATHLGRGYVEKFHGSADTVAARHALAPHRSLPERSISSWQSNC